MERTSPIAEPMRKATQARYCAPVSVGVGGCWHNDSLPHEPLAMRFRALLHGRDEHGEHEEYCKEEYDGDHKTHDDMTDCDPDGPSGRRG